MKNVRLGLLLIKVEIIIGRKMRSVVRGEEDIVMIILVVFSLFVRVVGMLNY